MRLADILRRSGVSFALAALAAGAAYSADDPAPKAAPAKSGPSKLEKLPNGGARVTLSEKAARRLGIETASVSEAPIVRTQVVGGLIVAASQVREVQPAPLQHFGGGFALPVADTAPPAKTPPRAQPGDEAWVQVSLSRAEWESLAKDKPARLLPLATRAKLTHDVLAQPSGKAPVEDMKRSMLTVYYVVPAGDPALEVNKRMRVELPLAGDTAARKVMPYSALYYDAQGSAWVYVMQRPLTYERTRVKVEHIVGDVAVLTEGPEVGATVVTVGAALLYGTEVFGK